MLNLFPLPRQAGFRESFAYAGESVDRGYSILVFPEGHHTTDGKIRPFRAGVGLLANNLAIPVVPMRIHGLFEVKKARKNLPAPGKIQINIGLPVQFRATATQIGLPPSCKRRWSSFRASGELVRNPGVFIDLVTSTGKPQNGPRIRDARV